MLAFSIAWIFYDSVYAFFLLLVPVIYVNGKRYSYKVKVNEEKEFIEQYKEMLKNVVSALETGYSVENAFVEAQRQQEKRFGKEAIVTKELRRINTAVSLKKPIEKAFFEFAERFPYEEVENFAEIFSFGKRLGGGYVDNLRTTAVKLEEKVALRQDISATIAQKQLELYVMSIMPVGIILYMRIGSPGFMNPLYHNPFGIVIMSVCIGVYILAIWLGKKVVSIEI